MKQEALLSILHHNFIYCSCLFPAAYGPVQSERSGEALRRTVCGWRNRIDGGGDCPELTLSGLVLALQNSAPDSVIVVFTDASAKDMDKLGEVLQLIREKRIKVNTGVLLYTAENYTLQAKSEKCQAAPRRDTSSQNTNIFFTKFRESISFKLLYCQQK